MPDDIHVVPSGVTGEDLWLSPTARALLPYAFECKNVERLNVWDAIEQAYGHVKDGDKGRLFPALVISRNRMPEPWVCVPLSVFLKKVV